LSRFFAFKQRQPSQVFAVGKHQVGCAVQEFGFVTQRVLEQLEVRDAVAADRD
jgi:hypothetical protein